MRAETAESLFPSLGELPCGRQRQISGRVVDADRDQLDPGTHRPEIATLDVPSKTLSVIIVSGQVKVVKDGKLLNVLKEGDCFGEMAYLSGDRARRSASIISVSEVQLLKIQSSHLESLSEGCQLRFNREFLRTLIERLTWTSSVLAQFRR